MQGKWLSLIFTLLFAMLAFVYMFFFELPGNKFQDLNIVLSSLLNDEGTDCKGTKKVAIGYGACMDLYVDGKDLFAGIRPPDDLEHFSVIKSKEELLKNYGYFFIHGAAAERYVSNATLFKELERKTVFLNSAIAHPLARVALGGNAPVMAKRMIQECCEVLLAAKMSDNLQEFLPSEVEVVGGNVHNDDVHLLIEYKAGETWGKYTSPRANRFIIHSDRNNPTISSLEEFGEHLPGFNPKLFIIGGLQMMDSFPFLEGVRVERLGEVRKQILSQPLETLVHFELASFADEYLFKDLLDNVIPFVDSLGMNEQELPNLYSMLRSNSISLVSDSNPRIAAVLDIMRDVYKMLSKTESETGERQLSRLHVHTLAYQAIMTTIGSAWNNNKKAVAKASLTANRHTCGSEEIQVRKAKLIMDDSFSTSIKGESSRVYFNISDPISCWQESISNSKVEFCVGPVLVCTVVKQTAGAGDNISSAALAAQI